MGRCRRRRRSPRGLAPPARPRGCGLVYDLSTLIDRRQVLKLAGFTTITAGLMSIAACAPGASGSALSSASATGTAGSSSAAGASSIQTMSRVSLESDNVFRDDGGVQELGSISGDVASGMTVSLDVPVRGA